MTILEIKTDLLISYRDILQNEFFHLEDELSYTSSQLYELKNSLDDKNYQMHKIQTSNAKNVLKLSLMFLRMKATKQKTEQKLQKIEKLCNEQIIHMKEQSDLMKFVTETLSQNDIEMKNCSNVVEISKTFY